MAKSHARWLREQAEREAADSSRRIANDDYLDRMERADIGAPVFRTSDTLSAPKPARMRPSRYKRAPAAKLEWVRPKRSTTTVQREQPRQASPMHFQPSLSDEAAVLYGHLPPKAADGWERDKGGKRKAVNWRAGAEAESSVFKSKD